MRGSIEYINAGSLVMIMAEPEIARQTTTDSFGVLDEDNLNFLSGKPVGYWRRRQGSNLRPTGYSVPA